jgi:AraC-like DNA-binding protein
MGLFTPFRHALPINEALFRAPLYLTHAGWEIIPPGQPYPPKDVEAPVFMFNQQEGRTLPEFCLALVVGGSGELQTGSPRGRRVPLNVGDAFFFRPGEWHRHRPSAATGWTAMWIHFNGAEPLQWMRDNRFNLRGNIPVIENSALFQAQFEYLLESAHRHPTRNSTVLSYQAIGLISHFLVTTPPTPGRAATDVEDDVVRAAVEHIWNFSHGIVDVPTVVQQVGVGRRTLHRRFKAATGRTILEEIQLCRVSRAVALLRETTLPIKYVVDRAGFRTEEHMRLAFQKAFGKPPMAYRKSETP